MRRLPLILLTLLVVGLSASPAPAQNPGQILDFFANQLEREIQRQQQRRIQRQQQHQHDQNWQIFVAAWNDCFGGNDLARCDFALSYPGIADNDQRRLQARRAQIAAALEAEEEAQRRAEAEQAEQAAQQREEEAARLREQELERQRAQAEHARRERIAEEQRLAAMRAFMADLQGCQRFEPASCDRALVSEHTSPDKLGLIRAWRTIGVDYGTDRAACRAGTVEACDRALASPAVTDADRGQLHEWRIAASPFHRAVAALSTVTAPAWKTAQTVPAIVRDLPLSTQITGSVAMMLAAALGIVTIRRRPAKPAQAAIAAAASTRTPRRGTFRRRLRRAYLRFLALNRRRRTPAEAAKQAAAPAPASLATVVDRPRDTETAVDALRLAFAYVREFHDDIANAFTDPAFAATTLNTLSLISRQLDIAERADPTATLTVDDKDGAPLTFTLAAMKAHALLYEGLCRASDDPKRAIRILEQAIALVPDAPSFHFWTGMLHASLLNKRAAVAAFETAVTLDPGNLDYRKELLRAQTISGAQVAFDRAASGVRTTVGVARWIWRGFWIIALVSFIAAILRGDPGTAIAIFVLFMLLGMGYRAIDSVKAWFAANAR